MKNKPSPMSYSPSLSFSYDLTAWTQKEASQLEEGDGTTASVLTASLPLELRFPYSIAISWERTGDFLIGAIRSSLYTMTPSAK